MSFYYSSLFYCNRLQREELSEVQLFDLLTSIAHCPQLERVFIYQEEWGESSPKLVLDLPDLLYDLFVQLPRLVAFCLVYPINECDVETISHRLRRDILSSRPSFWLYVGYGLRLPCNGATPEDDARYIPRIHLEEIVDPPEYLLPDDISSIVW